MGAADPSDVEALARGRAPSRVLDDVDVGLHAVGGAGGAHELAQRLDHAAAPTDEATHVVGVGVHQQRDLAAALLDLDVDRVGVVGEVAGDVLGHGDGRGHRRCGCPRRRLVVEVVVDVGVVDVVRVVRSLVLSGFLGGCFLGRGLPRPELPRRRAASAGASAGASLTCFSGGFTLPVL